jgi:hypothetical protein
VETTELVETAVSVLMVKDVEEVNASVTMTVTIEIVEPLLNLLVLIQQSALRDLAEPVPLTLLAMLIPVFVLALNLALLRSELLSVVQMLP